MSKTEWQQDYARFYKDERRLEYFGEDSYSGDATNQHNWPGVDGNAPLVPQS